MPPPRSPCRRALLQAEDLEVVRQVDHTGDGLAARDDERSRVVAVVDEGLLRIAAPKLPLRGLLMPELMPSTTRWRSSVTLNPNRGSSTAARNWTWAQSLQGRPTASESTRLPSSSSAQASVIAAEPSPAPGPTAATGCP
jgi:hypothetical protein